MSNVRCFQDVEVGEEALPARCFPAVLVMRRPKYSHKSSSVQHGLLLLRHRLVPRHQR
jgi:hypothetical protein